MKYCYSASVMHQLPGYQTINYLTLRYSQEKLISYGWNGEAGQLTAQRREKQPECYNKKSLEKISALTCRQLPGYEQVIFATGLSWFPHEEAILAPA